MGPIKDAITGKCSRVQRLTFFHLVGKYLSKEIIKAVLKWAEQTDDRLGLLSTAITGNDQGSMGIHFFIWLRNMDQKIVLKRY